MERRRGLLGPIAGRADFVEMLGRETLIGVATEGDQHLTLLAGVDAAVRSGDPVRIGVERDRLHLFAVDTQQALGRNS